MTRTINISPTWREAAGIIAAALENGTGTGKKAARAELFRMADMLDQLRKDQPSAEAFAVARNQPNGQPRFLRYVENRPSWTADSAKADHMPHDEAERLADDWNEHTASKGFARRAYVHQIEADQ